MTASFMVFKLLDRMPANTCGSLSHTRESLPKHKHCSRKKEMELVPIMVRAMFFDRVSNGMKEIKGP